MNPEIFKQDNSSTWGCKSHIKKSWNLYWQGKFDNSENEIYSLDTVVWPCSPVGWQHANSPAWLAVFRMSLSYSVYYLLVLV